MTRCSSAVASTAAPEAHRGGRGAPGRLSTAVSGGTNRLVVATGRLVVVGGLGLLLAACTSTPMASRSLAKGASGGAKLHTTAATPTAVPSTSTSTSPPATDEQANSINVEISGNSVVLQFVSSDLTGSLETADPAFSDDGMAFSFVIEGVSYGGAAVTSSAASGPIAEASAARTNGGVAVQVSLRSTETSYQFGLGHDLVGVSFPS